MYVYSCNSCLCGRLKKKCVMLNFGDFFRPAACKELYEPRIVWSAYLGSSSLAEITHCIEQSESQRKLDYKFRLCKTSAIGRKYISAIHHRVSSFLCHPSRVTINVKQLNSVKVRDSNNSSAAVGFQRGRQQNATNVSGPLNPSADSELTKTTQIHRGSNFPQPTA